MLKIQNEQYDLNDMNTICITVEDDSYFTIPSKDKTLYKIIDTKDETMIFNYLMEHEEQFVMVASNDSQIVNKPEYIFVNVKNIEKMNDEKFFEIEFKNDMKIFTNEQDYLKVSFALKNFKSKQDEKANNEHTQTEKEL